MEMKDIVRDPSSADSLSHDMLSNPMELATERAGATSKPSGAVTYSSGFCDPCYVRYCNSFLEVFVEISPCVGRPLKGLLDVVQQGSFGGFRAQEEVRR